ncbi:hypothetical protein BH23ACT3_BH23ACT3_06520 [soil metagenome]
MFVAAFTAMLAAQLSLMSLLDTDRAEDAAAEVASSAFVSGLIDDAVRSAVTPIAGPDIARQVGITAGNDPRVRDVVRSTLVSAHRQVVDPSAPRGPAAGTVNVVVGDVLDDLGGQAGVDLSGLGQQLDVPDARPERLPDVGLRSVASVTRLVGALVAVLAALATVVVHPRPARALAGLGARAAFVCGGWLVALIVVGWAIGRVAETLFGELLHAVWTSAVPAMLGVVGAGVLLGVGTWLGGRALDGLLAERRRSVPPHAAQRY